MTILHLLSSKRPTLAQPHLTCDLPETHVCTQAHCLQHSFLLALPGPAVSHSFEQTLVRSRAPRHRCSRGTRTHKHKHKNNAPTEPSVLAQPRLPGSGSPAPCRGIRSTSWPPRELPRARPTIHLQDTSTQHSLISPQARFSPAPNPAQPGPKSPIRRPPSPRPA